MLKNTFYKKKYIPVNPYTEDRKQEGSIPGKKLCPSCSSVIPETELVENFKVCPLCSCHFPLSARERIEMMLDKDSFREFDSGLSSYNVLDFPEYDEKLLEAEQNSGLKEAIITGCGRIGGHKLVLGVMESQFMMGSMGSAVGEKICRAVERAMEAGCPLLMCCTSGGARMQEGMLSLMQMAKTSAVLSRFHKEGLLYISIMLHPTTGGVSASFASLADIIIAEPGALIGFAGPRVIRQTIGQTLPDNFQRAEFLLEHGMVDMIVERSQLNATLEFLLRIHQGGANG
jgi:acetyl-CoA carboxylase carboxyl transferase subunit beta